MGFNTLSFIPFLLIVILLYFTIFRKCQWVFLLLASIAFYLFAGPKYIIFIFVSLFLFPNYTGRYVRSEVTRR